MGKPLTADELEHAYTIMTTVADRKKKVDDQDLEDIITEARTRTSTSAAAGPA
jgi:hypothetical protein